jgi:hypothetical protein
MPAEREVLNSARDRHQHWELTTAAMPAALLGELCEATAISCRQVLQAEDGLAGWRYRIPPCTATNCCACNSAAARGIEACTLRPRLHRRKWRVLKA